MGDYATTAAVDTLTVATGERHTTDLAMLHGARLVTASETEEGHAWADGRIKQLTGGDPITARFMRENNFTFKPTFKLMIVGNHKPTLHNVDEAARRRFNIAPFTRMPANPDLKLEAKLRAESPGILRWMIDGCLGLSSQWVHSPAIRGRGDRGLFQQPRYLRPVARRGMRCRTRQPMEKSDQRRPVQVMAGVCDQSRGQARIAQGLRRCDG
jgi:hypothetical protein